MKPLYALHMMHHSIRRDQVEIAPAYDLISTIPYIPRDSLALMMDGSKQFPEQARLLKIIRQSTGKTQKAARELVSSTG